MTPLTAVIDALAAARLTRLLTADSFPPIARTRVRVVEGPATPPWLAELVECPWCAGVWAGAGVAAARRLVPRLWGPLATALAYGQVAGLLNGQDR